MSRIRRYCKTEEELFGPNVFDCSRPNVMGNPYTHIKNRQTKALVVVKNREEAISLYGTYFDMMMESDDESGEKFREEFDKIYAAYKKFGEIFLGCYCHTDETCHCDVIRDKLLQRSMKEKLRNVARKPTTSVVG